MGKFLDYNPDQAYLLPPSVRDVLGEGHLCFFLRRVVAKLNLNAFRDEYGVKRAGLRAGDARFRFSLCAYALRGHCLATVGQRIAKTWHFAIWRAEQRQITGR